MLIGQFSDENTSCVYPVVCFILEQRQIYGVVRMALSVASALPLSLSVVLSVALSVARSGEKPS